MSCVRCLQAIDGSSTSCDLPCCGARFHILCMIEGIFVSSTYNGAICPQCQTYLYRVPTYVSSPSLSPSPDPSPERRAAQRDVKTKIAAWGKACTAVNRMITAKSRIYKEIILPNITIIRDLKRNFMNEVRQSPEWRCFNRTERVAEAARRKFRIQFGHLDRLRSSYRCSPRRRLRRSFYVRI